MTVLLSGLLTETSSGLSGVKVYFVSGSELFRLYYQTLVVRLFSLYCTVKKKTTTKLDFHSEGPGWGSCSLGVFICLDCSGIHRNIPDISKIKSLTLSHWEDHEVEVRFHAWWTESSSLDSNVLSNHLDERKFYL